MLSNLFNFYKISAPASFSETNQQKFKNVRFLTFLSITLGYGMYYVCRLSMNIIRKPIVEADCSPKRSWASLARVCSLSTPSAN